MEQSVAQSSNQTSILPAAFLSLPLELLTQILSRLIADPFNYHTLVNLRLTHPLFHSLLPLTSLKTQHSLLSARYFQAEVAIIASVSGPSVTTTTNWPCYICLHQCPRSEFAHNQTHASRSIGHGKARLRFCLACGVRKGIYGPGTTLRCFQGPDKAVCVSCQRLGVAAKSGAAVAQRAVHTSRESVSNNQDVRGCRILCEECAYATDPGSSQEGSDSVDHPDLEREHTLELQRIDRELGIGKGTSERKGRCQRCWAIDHTERPAEKMQGEQLLCQECWLQKWV